MSELFSSGDHLKNTEKKEYGKWFVNCLAGYSKTVYAEAEDIWNKIIRVDIV